MPSMMPQGGRWRLTPAGDLAVGAALWLVALAENTIAPWAPFYVLYAALTTLIPLASGTTVFGRMRQVRASTWLLAVVGPVLFQVVAGLWTQVLYPAAAGLLGVPWNEAVEGPAHSLLAALTGVFQVAGGRWDADPARLQGIYLGGILLWAGLGEELFFRGYMHEALRGWWGSRVAALVSAAAFGLRHPTQLALLIPDYPWGAAASWAAISFLFGLLMSWLYERDRSLYPPVLAHYVLNAIPAVALALGAT